MHLRHAAVVLLVSDDMLGVRCSGYDGWIGEENKVIDQQIPTRRECEEMVFELEFTDILTATIAEIALKSKTVTPYLVSVGQA